MKNKYLTDIIISPPFGNYLTFLPYTCVKGTYTLQERKGLLKQCVKTIRYTKDGWVNRIGLRNKGLENISVNNKTIYSVSVSEGVSWEQVFTKIIDLKPKMVEVNIGCPNNTYHELPGILPTSCLLTHIPFVSMKLPASAMAYVLFERYFSYGIRTFHCCNTIPSDKGGLSGRKVQDISLNLIKWIKSNLSRDDVCIIGGGGIYNKDDINKYKDAGTDHFSVSSIFFTPWKFLGLMGG